MKFDNQYGNYSRPKFRIGSGLLTPFIKWMIIINLGIFVFQQLVPQLSYILGLTPRRFFTEMPNLLYQPFTYMFLHGSFGHIFFNMFALWMFGTEIELNWKARPFAKFYLYSGLCGAILTLILNSGQMVPMIGASAAVYGVLAAYWVMYPNRFLYIYFLFPVKVKWAIPGFMLLGFLFGGPNVAHLAHLGGALFGFLYVKSDWRFLSWKNKIKNIKYKRQTDKLEKNKHKAEETMAKVDRVLDRISEVGIENLTAEERKVLEDASIDLSKKDK
jgi:membrane associated rhomboid family serine protease